MRAVWRLRVAAAVDFDRPTQPPPAFLARLARLPSGRERSNGRTARECSVTECPSITAPACAVPPVLALVGVLGVVSSDGRPPRKKAYGGGALARDSRLDGAVLLVCAAADAGVVTAPQASVAILRLVDGGAFRAGCPGVGSLAADRSLIVRSWPHVAMRITCSAAVMLLTMRIEEYSVMVRADGDEFLFPAIGGHLESAGSRATWRPGETITVQLPISPVPEGARLQAFLVLVQSVDTPRRADGEKELLRAAFEKISKARQ